MREVKMGGRVGPCNLITEESSILKPWADRGVFEIVEDEGEVRILIS